LYLRARRFAKVLGLLLYYITDRSQFSSSRNESVRLLLDRISAAASAGIDAIQLREKDLNARELVELGTRAAEIVRGVNTHGTSRTRTRLLVNSRVDAAIAFAADGVHLRSDDVSATDARVIFAQAGVSTPLIGVSCHTVQEVLLAEGHGADFAVYGPVFGKSSGQGAAAGLAGLKEASHRRRATQHPIPVLALGGVTVSNAADCLKAGADGIAGIQLFQNGNVMDTISRLRKLKEDLHY
jgi:thiamine-phosphate pyrophosphorylase